MYLLDTPKDPLARRPFKTIVILSLQDNKFEVVNSLVDYSCIGVYTIINETLVPKVYERLGLQLMPLIAPKPLRGYDGKLSKKLITHYLLLNLTVA